MGRQIRCRTVVLDIAAIMFLLPWCSGTTAKPSLCFAFSSLFAFGDVNLFVLVKICKDMIELTSKFFLQFWPLERSRIK